MTREPVTVTRGRTVKEALALLAEHGVTALPVVEPDGAVVGVVSEADLIRESVPADPRAHLRPIGDAVTPPRRVEEVYTPHAVTVRMHDDLAAAVELMTSTSVKSLPVIDERSRLVGIVARSDVVRMLARTDDAIAADLDAAYRDLGQDDWFIEVADGVVEVTGPGSPTERSIADVVARTVAGVVDVRIVSAES